MLSPGFLPAAMLATVVAVSLAIGVDTRPQDGSADVESAAFAATGAAERTKRRFVLKNRLLGGSCLIERNGSHVTILGACRQAFPAAQRITAWRERPDRVHLLDAMGSAVADFEWNDETGMSSVSSPLHPEAGALALLPVSSAD